jgi:transposase
MTSKRQPYKVYTKAFKLEAVRLMAQSDKPASEIAVELGIRRNQLYKWKEQLTSKFVVTINRAGVFMDRLEFNKTC